MDQNHFQDGKLSAALSKLLSDKLYEKRKQGALLVEMMTREALKENDHDRISKLISLLASEFIYSIVPNSRNGGLIALAAIAIALGAKVTAHLHEIVPPILNCLSDHDSRVRYYACEAMFNVGKVGRGSILAWFNEIFDALTKLSVDLESSVKNGAELLDRLIKDIVSEKSSYYNKDLPDISTLEGESSPLSSTGPPVPGSVPYPGGPLTFNLPRFIPLLMERIHVINAPGRLFLVQWIFVLNSVPDLELLTFLPDFLDGLLVFLSDGNADVRTATLNVLGEFLKEITNVSKVQQEHGVFKIDSIPPLSQSDANRPVSQLSVDPSTVSGTTAEAPVQTDVPNEPYIPGQGIVLDFGRMTETLIKYLSTQDEETRATALRWIISFMGISQSNMLPFTPLLLGSILPTLSHQVFTIKSLAMDANTNLYALVINNSTNGSLNHIDIPATVTKLMSLCQDEHKETRVGALEWLLMLHKKYPSQVMNTNQDLFQGLLKTLSDFSEEVVRRDLTLLAQISQTSEDKYFYRFMKSLLKMFATDRRVLETRGALIIRQLSLSLNPEKMFISFGDILEEEGDLEFATTMVQTLNLILITAPELGEMRRRLKNIESRDGMALFTSLYKSWCHNPIACFTLCLLCQAYEHASNLLTYFGELEITVAFLIQTDKLVQLLESPVFTSLRLQLLEPDKYPQLYKCLYGILMLLPQSSAFSTLRNRLSSLSSLSTLTNTIENMNMASNNSKKKPFDPISSSKWQELLTHFKMIQARHERARRALNERQWKAETRPRSVSALPSIGSSAMMQSRKPPIRK